MMNEVLRAALSYARRGWRVLPVVEGGKVPATSHGVKDATCDEDRIHAWFGSERGAKLNIGIACGKDSGLVVYDIDPRNGGDLSWETWEQYHGLAPAGPMAFTAGGGAHYLAQYAPGVRSTKLADGIDLLSDGRYFVAYPSQIEGRQYYWEDSSRPIAIEDGDDTCDPFTMPPAWLATVTATKERTTAGVAPNGLIQGNRNAGLTALAGSMRRYGMSEAEILAALTVANETRCEVPLPASEVRGIAQSVSRYEPESDVAAHVALGDDAVEELLAASQAARHDYYLTRATAFLKQPSPIEWAVQGWIPLSGTTMVYGESAAGKTFLTLDIAASVASQSVDWCGLKTKHGVAVYLAGEGNYGLRQRVAAWATRHKVDNLDRLLVSNRALDLDDPDAVGQVLRAVSELTNEQVTLCVIDTVNNHMAGDENSAKDVRQLFGSVNTVAAALGCPVILNHHVGNSQEARTRARGSSAFKASLDSSILVANRRGAITVTCTKMKDGPSPEPLHGRIESIDLPWYDDTGTVISGAVWTQTEGGEDDEEDDEQQQARAEQRQARADQRRERRETDRTERWRSFFERAWFNSGCPLDNEGMPYVSKVALRDWLTANQRSMKSGTIEQHLKASAREGSMIRDLLDTNYIDQTGNGWVVSHPTHSAALLAAMDER